MNNSDEYKFRFANANWTAFVVLIILLMLINVLLYLLPIDQDAKDVILFVSYGISIILWIDFALLFKNASNRRRFMIDDLGWLALLGSFPMLHVLRLLWMWIIFRRYPDEKARVWSHIRIARDAQGTLLTIALIAIIIFESAGVFILNFEDSAAGANISSAADALWWAFVSVTTVGYGDKYPVTSGGRWVGVILMIVGIGLFSVITGFLVDWFQSPKRLVSHPAPGKNEQDPITEMRRIIDEQEQAYQATIAELRKRLSEMEDSR